MVNSKRTFSEVFGVGLLVFTVHNSLAQSCASVDTHGWATWSVSTGDNFAISQSSGGHLSGQMTAGGGGNCPSTAHYTISGEYWGSGNFGFTAYFHDDGNPFHPQGQNPGCVNTVSFTGTLQKPGCNNASGSWNNSGGGSGTYTMTHACFVPSAETTPQVTGWGGDGVYPTSAVFHQSIIATDFDWGGRTISETFPQDGIDTCWWPGSKYTQTLRGIPWAPITFDRGAPSGYYDAVGMSPTVADYYRKQGKSPCGFTLYQRMTIDCPNGNTPYITNTLYLGVEPTTVTNKRAGVPATEVWGSPAPSYIMSILNRFFFD